MVDDHLLISYLNKQLIGLLLVDADQIVCALGGSAQKDDTNRQSPDHAHVTSLCCLYRHGVHFDRELCTYQVLYLLGLSGIVHD